MREMIRMIRMRIVQNMRIVRIVGKVVRAGRFAETAAIPG
jgi:hypothetical protein